MHYFLLFDIIEHKWNDTHLPTYVLSLADDMPWHVSSQDITHYRVVWFVFYNHIPHVLWKISQEGIGRVNLSPYWEELKSHCYTLTHVTSCAIVSKQDVIICFRTIDQFHVVNCDCKRSHRFQEQLAPRRKDFHWSYTPLIHVYPCHRLYLQYNKYLFSLFGKCIKVCRRLKGNIYCSLAASSQAEINPIIEKTLAQSVIGAFGLLCSW